MICKKYMTTMAGILKFLNDFYMLVSKLKKTKIKVLRCTGYLNSIKKTYKARFIANSSSSTTTELSKLLTSCLTSVQTCYQVL